MLFSMTLPKQKFREIVYVALFAIDMGNDSEDEVVKLIMDELKVTRKQGHEGYRKALEISLLRDKLDQYISEVATSYDISRIPSAEKNVLRMGVYDLIEVKEIPPLVAIAESIRLSRKFATPESASFVNAILDTLHKKYGKE